MEETTTKLTMDEAIEKYGNSFNKFEEGGVTEGTVIAIQKDSVVIDVGYKSEGAISKREFLDEDGNLNVKVGDTVEVMVEFWDEREETVHLSKDKAEKIKVWDYIENQFKENEIIKGKVLTRIKGGFSVNLNGVQAFLPGSQADLKPIKNMDEIIGKTYEFKILKFNQKKNNIVLSRRALLEEERKTARKDTLKTIKKDNIVEGVVKNITEYGIFIDIGGIDGLLHITDISWGRVKNPTELFKIGSPTKVKILAFDEDKERVSLGMKQLIEDPWIQSEERYPIGTRITGKVVSLTEYGAFIELEEGIEGLVHISEMSWTKKIRHPSNMLSIGEAVETVVLDLKKDERRISLGIKQVVPNPWEIINEKYPVGTIIEGQIKNITDFGVFVGIDADIDGLVHISDISWTKRIKHPSEVYKKGDTVQAVVLDIDKENERFSLGIKQNQDDPWNGVDERYPIGTEVEGKITNVTDFGIFVELQEGVDGLIHISEISEEKIETPVGLFKNADLIKALVMNINTQERRIGLSIKQLGLEVSENPATSDNKVKNTVVSGDLKQELINKMQKKAAEEKAESKEEIKPEEEPKE